MTPTLYRANYGDGTHGRAYADIRDARRDMWGRAGIVQYRTAIEGHPGTGGLADGWIVVEPSAASRNGPPIVAADPCPECDDPIVVPVLGDDYGITRYCSIACRDRAAERSAELVWTASQ